MGKEFEQIYIPPKFSLIFLVPQMGHFGRKSWRISFIFKILKILNFPYDIIYNFLNLKKSDIIYNLYDILFSSCFILISKLSFNNFMK